MIVDGKPWDDDLKQRFVYNTYWKTGNSLLLYPTNHENPDKEYFGNFHRNPYALKNGNKTKLGFINVLKKGSLDLEIGERVFEKLTINQ